MFRKATAIEPGQLIIALIVETAKRIGDGFGQVFLFNESLHSAAIEIEGIISLLLRNAGISGQYSGFLLGRTITGRQ
jgi:hypothetical protein